MGLDGPVAERIKLSGGGRLLTLLMKVIPGDW